MKGKYEYIPVCMVDIGWQSTTVSIVEKHKLKQSFSFDVSGTVLTKDLSEALKISLDEAEKMKVKYGLDPKNEDVSKVLLEKVEILALEIEKVCNNFYTQEGKRVDNIVLAGGTASLFGLKEYLSSRIKKNVFLADPFSSVSFPEALSKRLKEIGPSFSVALGTAMMGLES